MPYIITGKAYGTQLDSSPLFSQTDYFVNDNCKKDMKAKVSGKNVKTAKTDLPQYKLDEDP